MLKKQKSKRKKKRKQPSKKIHQKKGDEHIEILRIDEALEKETNLFEQTLFHTAIDSMLRSSDLLELTVEDITYESGEVREKLIVIQQKTGVPVHIFLMKETQELLEKFIKKYNKKRKHYLFTTRTGRRLHGNRFRHFIKRWTKLAGIKNVEDYSGHTTRRTKAVLMYKYGVRNGMNEKVNIGEISKALGHTSTRATLDYLGVDELDVEEALKAFPLWNQAPLHRPIEKYKYTSPESFNVWDVDKKALVQIETYQLLTNFIFQGVQTKGRKSQIHYFTWLNQKIQTKLHSLR